MTFCVFVLMASDSYLQQSIYSTIILEFTNVNVVECRYVTIYLLFSISCLHKLVYGVSLTSKLPLVCLAK